MIIRKGNAKKDEWTFILCFSKASYLREMGWYNFCFGIFKLKQDPIEGVTIQSQKKSGFFFEFYVFLPVY